MTALSEPKTDRRGLTTRARNVRRNIVKMVAAAKSGHPGGSLSETELLVALYFNKMRHDPANPGDPDRDRFLLSKGHASPGLYSVLAEAGYFPESDLGEFRQLGSKLQGHPSLVNGPPGIEIQGGSLGHGLSLGIGMALGNRLDDRDSHVYVLLGDGELQEGEIWEAAMAATKFALSSLTAIVDWNKVQQDGDVDETMPLGDLPSKWRGSGWGVREIDGHNFDEILDAYDWAKVDDRIPKVILAHTIKGKGVSYMENQASWHGKAPNEEQLAQALTEIG